MANRHQALYGNISIPRVFCDRPGCKRWTLVVDGIRQCCNWSTKEDFKAFKERRMSIARNKRKQPSKTLARKLLEIQEYKCFYCVQSLKEWVTFRGKPRLLRVEYDHVEPFMFSQNNYGCNFVAACHVCNGWKGSKYFQNIEVAKDYLVRKWEANRWQKARKKDLAGLVRTVEEATNKTVIGNVSVPSNVNGDLGKQEIQE